MPYKDYKKQLESSKKNYLLNREKRRGQQKVWAEKNREKRTAYARIYRQTDSGKSATLRAIKNYETRHPERRSAWNEANSKILNKPCQICGKKAHKHHPDINKPLEVIHLCPFHHKQVHLGNAII